MSLYSNLYLGASESRKLERRVCSSTHDAFLPFERQPNIVCHPSTATYRPISITAQSLPATLLPVFALLHTFMYSVITRRPPDESGRLYILLVEISLCFLITRSSSSLSGPRRKCIRCWELDKFTETFDRFVP